MSRDLGDGPNFKVKIDLRKFINSISGLHEPPHDQGHVPLDRSGQVQRAAATPVAGCR